MAGKKKNAVSIDQFEVPARKLCVSCDTSKFGFKTTERLRPIEGFIGQKRAEEALRRGLGMKGFGWNIFAVESGESGRESSLRWYIEKMVRELWASSPRHVHDWCYVYNFENPDEPKVLKLEKGKGKGLKHFVEAVLLGELKMRMPSIAEFKYVTTDEKSELDKAEEETLKAQRAFMDFIQIAAQDPSVLDSERLVVELVGVATGGQSGIRAPRVLKLLDNHGDGGQPQLTQELSREDMQEVPRVLGKFNEKALELDRAAAEHFSNLERLQDKIRKKNMRRVFEELAAEAMTEFEGAEEFLYGLGAYAEENHELFLPKNPQAQAHIHGQPAYMQYMEHDDSLVPFDVNLFIDNSKTEGVPIVFEDNPTYFNLFGKLERRGVGMVGSEDPDHMDLKAGSISRANGGVLIVDALDFFQHGGWEGLKRVLTNEELNIEGLAEQWIIPIRGLKPQSIPTKLKVVLIGESGLYYMLTHVLGEKFTQLFRVVAQFDDKTERTDENVNKLARLIGGWCRSGEGMKHLDTSAFAEVVRESTRMADDQGKLSLRMRTIKDICAEASYIAQEEGAELVSAQHIRQALTDKTHRVDIAREKIQQMIDEGILLISVEGSKVGQVNALVVYSLDDFQFGRPVRVTCNVFAGSGGVSRFDKDANMTGRVYNKAGMIINGYLSWKYGSEKNLNFSATISFEQSYEKLDGDSASAAEFALVLSTLSNLPLRQDVAITGSCNQKGEIQPIGGVNEKIEGFFDVCMLKGLSGNQGVIIPHQNVGRVVLRDDVIQAVESGQFHIYAIKTVEEAVEILTGRSMGEKIARGEKKGQYPKGTINHLAEKRLGELVNNSGGKAKQ